MLYAEQFVPARTKDHAFDFSQAARPDVAGVSDSHARKQSSNTEAVSESMQRSLDAIALARDFAAPLPPARSAKQGTILIGESAPMRALMPMIDRVAPTLATVLIIGESGTGKEVVARLLHERSNRSKKPFVALNCGAISPNLIEAELFGHERGSFTGAVRSHKGCFERAQGGTLFLDEITEMPLDAQVKLLRVLETRSFTRVGGDDETGLDVRIITATNRKLDEALAQGRLREDLMYRISVFPLHLPTLRERVIDIALLAKHFLDQLNLLHDTKKVFAPRALDSLAAHAWPGNVRELKNVVERAYILADDEVAFDTTQFLSAAPNVGGFSTNRDGAVTFLVGTSLAEVERKLINMTLAHCHGNKREAAELLGVSLKTVYNRLNEYRLHDQPLAA